MPGIPKLLRSSGLEPPADQQAIARAEKAVARALPQDYRVFLAQSNGYEALVDEKGYLCLWRAEDIHARNEQYQVDQCVGDITLIGSNGGGIAYGIDWSSEPCRYVAIPFILMIREDVRPLSHNFAGFVRAVADGEGW